MSEKGGNVESFFCFLENEKKKIYCVFAFLVLGIITLNPPVVWAKITLPTCGLKSVT